jgi:hypothetical protein
MTTIAYKAGIMACDSCWSYDDGVDSLQTKIKRLKSGALLGSAGDNDSRELERLLDSAKIPSQLPTKGQIMAIRVDYLGILVLPKGRVYKIGATHQSEANWNAEFKEDVGLWEISGDFTSVGTGSRWAMGAMAAGKSAVDAVRIACRFDLNSRAPVYQYQLRAGK